MPKRGTPKVKRLICFLLLFLLITSAAPQASGQKEGLRILKVDPSGILLEWVAPEVSWQLAPDGELTLKAGDWPILDPSYYPQVPYAHALIVLPPGITPTLRILEADALPVKLPAALDKAEVSPESHFVLKELGKLRGLRLASLTFYPALPEGKNIRIVRRVRAEIRWPPVSLLPFSPDPIQASVLKNVINPQHAYPSEPNFTASVTPSGSSIALVEFSKPGLYRIRYEDLQPLGLGEIDPHYLHFYQGSEEIAVEWEGDDDTTFEPGEAFLFYAEPRSNRWSTTDSIRITAEQYPGLRMSSRNANPTGSPASPWVRETWEENNIYTPDCFCGQLPAGRDGDRWTWADLKNPGSPTFSYTFKCPADPSHPTRLTLWLIGYTSSLQNPDHKVEVYLNSLHLGAVQWDGKTAITATFTIPARALTLPSTLTLTLPGIPSVAVEGAWLDAFALDYVPDPQLSAHQIAFSTELSNGPSGPSKFTVRLAGSPPFRAYEVTNPQAPVKLSSFAIQGNNVTIGDPGGSLRHYFVTDTEGVMSPVRIRKPEPLPEPGADYLIISHPDFLSALSPLVSLRGSQGLKVKVANLQSIYDHYSNGLPDPEAIRAFLADAYRTWNPRPLYVLLVGDGTIDPKRFRSDSQPTYLPPYLAEAGPEGEEIPADNRYACVDGNDNLPDMLIGRLPARSAGEARAMVEKIVAYETSPLPGEWNARILFVADNPDYAGDFHAWTDEGYSLVKEPFVGIRLYCSGSDPSNPSICQDVARTREKLLREWNQGALFVSWMGHSSWHQWEHGNLFHLNDIPSLTNSRRLPVVLEMTCFTGFFARPDIAVLDEELVRAPAIGAIAAFGPSMHAFSPAHRELLYGFMEDFFENGQTRLGQLSLNARLKVNLTAYPWVMDVYHLFGDPALSLQTEIKPWPFSLFLPIVLKSP